MQHNDESPVSSESTTTTDQHPEARSGQLNRRRLVQGAAVGVVPAILTLRSGGVAALSACPGQVAGTATVTGGTGDLKNFSGVARTNLNNAQDDECFVSATACDDPDYVSGASRPTNMGWVKKLDGNTYRCTDGTASGYYIPDADQNIMILTASSTVSLL